MCTGRFVSPNAVMAPKSQVRRMHGRCVRLGAHARAREHARTLTYTRTVARRQLHARVSSIQMLSSASIRSLAVNTTVTTPSAAISGTSMRCGCGCCCALVRGCTAQYWPPPRPCGAVRLLPHSASSPLCRVHRWRWPVLLYGSGVHRTSGPSRKSGSYQCLSTPARANR
jgi:hypothetical protein